MRPALRAMAAVTGGGVEKKWIAAPGVDHQAVVFSRPQITTLGLRASPQDIVLICPADQPDCRLLWPSIRSNHYAIQRCYPTNRIHQICD